MIRRLAIALLVCGGLGFFLQREMERGSFDAWHRVILEELRQWQGAPPPAPVTLVELRRGDLPFESWPPAPMDYALIFESLVRREPRTVAVQSLLDWPAVDALDAATLAERIALLPRGVLACTLSNSPLARDGIAPLAPLKYVAGDTTALPSFTGAGQAPIDDMRGGKAAGFTRIEFGENPQAHETHVSIPLLAQKDGQVFPSLLLQTMLAWEGRGSDDALVTLGRDIIISPTLRLPIDHAGRFALPTRLADPIRRLDAGSLLLDLEKDASLLQTQPEALETLRGLKGALLVLGETGENTPRVSVGPGVEWTEAELLAQTLRAALSGHLWREPGLKNQWIAWALAGAGGLLLLFSPRRWLVVFALGGAAALAFGLILAFLYGRWWLPPLPPLALWAAASVVAALLPAAKTPEKTPAVQPATPPSSAPAPVPPVTAPTEPAETPAAEMLTTDSEATPSWEKASGAPLLPAASDAPSLPPAESHLPPPTPAPALPETFPEPAPSSPDSRDEEEAKETEEDHALVHQLLEETDAPDEAAPPTIPEPSAEITPPPALETESPVSESAAPASTTPPSTEHLAEKAAEPITEPSPEPTSEEPPVQPADIQPDLPTSPESEPEPPAAEENSEPTPELSTPAPAPALTTPTPVPAPQPVPAPIPEPSSEEPPALPASAKPTEKPTPAAARPPITKKLHKKKKPPHTPKKTAPPPDKHNG